MTNTAHGVKRIFAEKKPGFDVEAQSMLHDLKENLGIEGLESLRIINRYDVEGVSEEDFANARDVIFSEPPLDMVYIDDFKTGTDELCFAVEYLPGQYDQRADSASQCLQMLTMGERPLCRAARLIVLKGAVSASDYERIKSYSINSVESREASLNRPVSLDEELMQPSDVLQIADFTAMDAESLRDLRSSLGLAMSEEDLFFCREYFRDEARRNPTMTEIRLIDTYWSDHCRHTTFQTKIENVEFQDGRYSTLIKEAFNEYLDARAFVHGDKEKDICLMDLATIGAKELRKKGMLEDLDVSDEINACSIKVKAKVDGAFEDWLVMFKNETHNHPTEIEPFGGAATCLGGAIRDPLSGRAYVYQAMRVTGSGDPRAKVSETLAGKLPQRKITTRAAAGYSSYGNQIGLATGQVSEIYDEGYVAKRMEVGAVIGAAPLKNVVRETPVPGDQIILLGGRTGRDGCGGATGSSKEHDEESLFNCSAEVQKGNPPTERKIQRLFRNSEASRLIKKCNDFGAGGVAVAIGELADGLLINLDAVPKKYEGLDGTELAISESQERMAVVVAKENAGRFIALAEEENLEATVVAEVSREPRLVMKWRGSVIVDISRAFLDTNGVKQTADAYICEPVGQTFAQQAGTGENLDELSLQKRWMENLQDLNICSQKGLVERFDSTIGAGSVLLPYGGKYQLTPAEGMAAKLPVPEGETDTATLMTFGYNPSIAKWSTFHGAMYSVVEAAAKITSMGGDYSKSRMSFQEYFERLGSDPQKWGRPLSALLGAYIAQRRLGIAAIGGKDSMSGTFKDMSVPPTLIAFSVVTVDAAKIISPEFKKTGSNVVLLKLNIDNEMIPDFKQMEKNYKRICKLISEGEALSAISVRNGGIAAAVSKMCVGNMMGLEFGSESISKELFNPLYGSIILEMKGSKDEIAQVLDGLEWTVLGKTVQEAEIRIKDLDFRVELSEISENWQQPLEKIFPTKTGNMESAPENQSYEVKMPWHNHEATGSKKIRKTISAPRIFIPVFPGTNCEFDTAKAFERAGGKVDVMVLKNLTSLQIAESIKVMKEKIDDSQIVVIPGGFSAGDEPDGSGKFIATAFRNPYIAEAINNLLKNRDGLMLGICNGFQALIKLGLVPYGEIRDISEDCPTLTYNEIGRHVSGMVNTRITSNISPWFSKINVGDIHSIPVSHGEGRFVAKTEDLQRLAAAGQIATQYVDLNGNASMDIRFNPNGSNWAIEGITSPDGRVLGKMGHSERIGKNVAVNVPGDKDQKLFESGIEYFS